MSESEEQQALVLARHETGPTAIEELGPKAELAVIKTLGYIRAPHRVALLRAVQWWKDFALSVGCEIRSRSLAGDVLIAGRHLSRPRPLETTERDVTPT